MIARPQNIISNLKRQTMKYKALIIATISVFCFLTFFSGIIRHDVDENAHLQLAAQKQFDCVGQIDKDTTVIGSCALISERFVLITAHVFIDSDTTPDTMELNGQKIIAYVSCNNRVTDVTKLNLVSNGQKVKVKNLMLHPTI